MAFTTWAALLTSLKDALSDHIANGDPCIGEYEVNGFHVRYNGPDQLQKWIKFIEKQIAKETAGSPSSRVSYGRHRRFA